MTPRHILSRYERVRDALPAVRNVGKLSFWLSCLYVAEKPRTIRDLAAATGLTYNQAKLHLRVMRENELLNVTLCSPGSRTQLKSLFIHAANDRLRHLLGLNLQPEGAQP